MADGEVIIAIDGDSTGFEKEVTGTKAQAAKLAAEYKKQGLSSSEAFKKAWADIKGASEDGSDTVTKNAQVIGKSFTAAGKESSAAVEKAFDDVKEASSEAARTVEEKADNANNSFDKIKSAGALALGAVATAATTAGTALAGIGAYAVKIGSDFEAGMSEVQAISRASSDEMEALADKAKAMGATTKFSASESAEAFKYMAQAGWDSQAMLDGISGVMDLAAASGEDLALTSSIVTDTLTAFGMAASEAGSFADVLAMAANASNTGVAEMGYTFKYVAPVAGALGYSIEDVSVAIGLMANSGIKAETAGTALRATLTNLAKPSDDVAMYMERLGVSLTDSSGKVKPLNALMDELRGSFAKLTDAQKAEYAAGLAGKEAMSGLLAIVNASDSDYKTLTQNINNASGAAKEAADIMQDNLKGAVEELGGGLETVGLQIYDSLQTPLKEAAKSASSSVSEISNSLKSGQLKSSMDTLSKTAGEMVAAGAELASSIIPKLINNLAYLVNHAKPAVDVLKAGVVVLGAWKSGLAISAAMQAWSASVITARAALESYLITQKVATASTALSTIAIAAKNAAVSVLAGKIGLATAAQWVWNAAMTANPIGVVVTGVAALTAGIIGLVAWMNRETDAEKAAREVMEERNEAIEQRAESWKQMQDASQQNINASLSEIALAEQYIEELRRITDENGEVKDGYEGRAAALYELINSAIPGAVEANETEEGSIYKIGDAIDEVIAKKKAQAVLDSMQGEYAEATKNWTQAQIDLAAAESALDDGRKTGAANLKELEDAYAKAKQTADGYMESMAQYEGLEAAMTQGKDAISAALTDIQVNIKTAGGANVDELRRQAEETAAAYQYVLQEFESGNSNFTQAHVDTIKKASEEAVAQYDIALADQQARAAVGVETMVASMTKTATEGIGTMSTSAAQAAKTGFATVGSQGMQGFSEALAAKSGDAAAGAKKVKELCEAALKGDTSKYGKDYTQGYLTGILATDPSPSVAEMVQKALGSVANTQANIPHRRGLDFSEGYAGGITAGKDGAVNAAASIAAAALWAVKNTQASNSPSKKTKSLGKNFGQGFSLGIQDEQGGVEKASATVALAAINAAKDAAGIHSPSRVMREQVGRMLAMGMALGIEDGEPAVKAAVTLLSEGAINSARDEATSFKEVGSLYMDNLTYGIEAGRDRSITAMEQAVKADVEAYKKKVDDETDTLVKAKQKQMEKVGKVQKTALQKEIDTIKSDADKKKKAYEDAGKEVTDGYKTALTEGYDEALAIVKEKVTDITDEFQAAHDDLIDRQEAMQSKLSEFGDLFTINDSGDLSLNNLEKNIDAIGRYQDALTELKDKGVSDEFMQQVTSLGVEEGTKFAEKLLQLTPDAFEKYTTTWQEQQDLAKTVAQQFYADQLTALDEDFTQKLDGALENVPTLLTGIGEDSIQGMIDGMYSKSGALSTAARSIVSAAIQAMRDAADIHSPSRKVAKLVGAPMAEGVAVGFDKQMADVYRQVSQTLDGEIGKMSAEVKVQADRQAAQSSPAPVQTIMRTEVIEKTPVIKFDGTLGALARVLQPEIEIVKKHKGGNLVKGEI